MPFTELSMGMSRDYDLAIANGATFVALGPHFSNRERIMSFKDRFDRLIDYFTEDGDEYDVQEAPAQAVGASQPVPSSETSTTIIKTTSKAVVAAKEQKSTPVAVSRPQVVSTAVVESASISKIIF